MSTGHSARETEQLGFGQGVSKGNIVGKKQGYDARPGCVLVCQLLGIQEGGHPCRRHACAHHGLSLACLPESLGQSDPNSSLTGLVAPQAADSNQ